MKNHGKTQIPTPRQSTTRPALLANRQTAKYSILCTACLALTVGTGMLCPAVNLNDLDEETAALLAAAPTPEMGSYDEMGTLRTADEARALVVDAGLDPEVEDSYLRLGLVELSEERIITGRDLFLQGQLGDPFAVSNILSFAQEFGKSTLESALDSFDAANDPNGTNAFLRDVLLTSLVRPKEATTNLKVTLSRDLKLGTQTIPAGTVMRTGLDVAAGNLTPVGFDGGSVSCAICHASVDPNTGLQVVGRPNTDLDIALFLALSPNSASSFLKVNASEFDPMDPRYPRTGRRIIDSNNEMVTLPDPIAFEAAYDDFLLSVPKGSFDAGPDSLTSPARIPDNFVFGEGGMGWDGGFQIGPFAGVTAFSSAVHAFELSLIGPFFSPEDVSGVDPEVLLGTMLQNAADPDLRIPDDVKPSEWLNQNFPGAERERLATLPSFPDPDLFSLNGQIFAPPGERVLESANALAAFQATLNVPPNRSTENFLNTLTGAVARGAEVFRAANCANCHAPPFFTNGEIIASDVIGTNDVRGKARNALVGRLVEAQLPSFDQLMPLGPNPTMLDLPPAPGMNDNLSLPPGLDTGAGGYKVTALRGAYFNAPYLHDAGVAVHPNALAINADGSYTILDENGIGVPGTSAIAEPVDPAHSLRALLDRDLRAILIANNAADERLQTMNVEGKGHDFFVDPAAGFTYQQQTDLIAFLLSLDDDPGAF